MLRLHIGSFNKNIVIPENLQFLKIDFKDEEHEPIEIENLGQLGVAAVGLLLSIPNTFQEIV